MNQHTPDVEQQLVEIQDRLDRVTDALTALTAATHEVASAVGELLRASANRPDPSNRSEGPSSRSEARGKLSRPVVLTMLSVGLASLIAFGAWVFWPRHSAEPSTTVVTPTVTASTPASAPATTSSAPVVPNSAAGAGPDSPAGNRGATPRDAVFFELGGTSAAPSASGQLLWSRSRGLTFKASRLPAAPAGGTYQVWLVTTAGTVSAGRIVPDATGHATLTIDGPQQTAPVDAVTVTLEPARGSTAPTGTTFLAGR